MNQVILDHLEDRLYPNQDFVPNQDTYGSYGLISLFGIYPSFLFEFLHSSEETLLSNNSAYLHTLDHSVFEESGVYIIPDLYETLVNGMREGIFIELEDQYTSIINYHKGKMEGKYIVLHGDELISETMYRNNLMNGKHIQYEKGIIIKEDNYINGEKIK